MTSLNVDLVKQFVQSMVLLRDEVLRDLPDALSTKGLLERVNREELPREGVVSGGVHYEVHGVGCRFWRDDGLEVDVDIDEGGGEVFDAWRFQVFLLGLGRLPSVTIREVDEFLRNLAGKNELRVVEDGWYAAAAGYDYK
jgi:hypothetical protein